MDMLDDLVHSASKPVKIFVSSRLDGDVVTRLPGKYYVAVRATDNGVDIARFVDEAIASRRRPWYKMSDLLRVEVAQTLCIGGGVM
jgi:hypothetical protein